MTQPVNILMTGGGAPGAAGILHCLRQEKSFNIIVADASGNAAGKYLNDAFAVIPRGDDPHFTEAVLTLCRREKIDIVLPLVTKELLPFARGKNLFDEESIRVLVSPAESLEIANDKSRLYQFLQWKGIAVPEFMVADTIEQFTDAVSRLGYPGRPVCFKPSVSNGSRGFRIMDATVDEQELLFTQKPSATYITYENAVAAFRELIGATNPAQAAEGTIRKLYATSVGENAVHGSDSDENAKIEGDFFFSGLEKL